MRVQVFILSILLLLVGTADTAAYESEFVPTDCVFRLPGRYTADCGDLLVPLDYANPDGDKIKLGVAILRHPDNKPQADPIIYLEGGPGGSTLEILDVVFNTRFRPLFAANRDIIVFDQRGVGASSPALDCQEYNDIALDVLDHDLDGVSLNTDQSHKILVNSLKACGERLSQRYDLRFFTSAHSAADIEALRLALGYEQVNLWGISYGTRLALTAMRDTPDAIRSVVLDSVYPPNANLFTEVPVTRQRALGKLFAACEADQACDNRYPALEETFFETVEMLNDEPIRINTIDSLTGTVYEDVVFNGDDFLIITLSLMYQTDVIPLLPQLIDQMSNGNYGLYALLAGSAFGQQQTISIGKYYAVECHEELNFITLDDITNAYLDFPELARLGSTGYGIGAVLEICAAFETGDTDTIEELAVNSDIPTLLLAGEYDPITPPEWAQRSAETLSNHTFVELPHHGHGASASMDCAQSLTAAFVLAPESELDTSCVDDYGISFRGAQLPADTQENYAPMLWSN